MARKSFCFAPVLCLLLLATGCGQKGPLYLPGDPDEEQIEIPQEEDETAPEDEQESGEQSDE